MHPTRVCTLLRESQFMVPGADGETTVPWESRIATNVGAIRRTRATEVRAGIELSR